MSRAKWIWAAVLASTAWRAWRRRAGSDRAGHGPATGPDGGVRAYEPVERQARRSVGGGNASDAAAWEAESGAMRDA